MRAVDAVGLVQLIPASFSWNVVITADLLEVNITGGPPPVYALPVAVVHLYAHLNSGYPVTNVRFEVKLGKARWAEGEVVCADVGELCNYTTPALAVGQYELQVRAIGVCVDNTCVPLCMLVHVCLMNCVPPTTTFRDIVVRRPNYKSCWCAFHLAVGCCGVHK
jgi:hypothetical protein